MFYLNEFPDQEVHTNYSQKYKDYNIDKFLTCVYLLKTGSEALKAFESFLSKYNLSQAKFLTLMILFRSPEESLTPSEIARIMGVKKPTSTGVIDGLLKENYVTRELDETDRRKIKIKISSKGSDHLDKILPEYFKYINKIMDEFSGEECSDFKDLLFKVLLNTEKIGDSHHQSYGLR